MSETTPNPSSTTTTASDVPNTSYGGGTEADVNFSNPQGPPVFRFVMTGGPCGGKTTALARVFSFLRERGFEVITCPEAYTLLVSNGMSAHLFSTPGMDTYIQSAVLDTQMTLEDSVQNVLKARGKPSVILCDRGSMDGTVYMGQEKFAKYLLESRKTDIVQVRDNRYDAIFHLVTAADGALNYYSLDNNAVRTETPEQAIEVDRKTQKAWVGHPHLYVIDNSTDFEGKMSRLVDVICKIVGLPSNLKRRSAKFLLQPSSLPLDPAQIFPPDIDYQLFDVEKVYLQRSPSTSSSSGEDDNGNSSDENYGFVRKRNVIDLKDGTSILGTTFQLTTVTMSGGEMIEQKRIISEREYLTAVMSRDTSRHVIEQRRISFLYKLQSFTIHIYKQPVAHIGVLHAQVEAKESSGEQDVELPPFLKVERQLLNSEQDESMYGAYSISRIDK
uniref:NadR/Ttd14 AAA domain-containing protein n=1 Tax=Entomoneis paludosa TaxID=265537 RepID=A0A7S2YIE1_9STRA